MTLLTTDTKNAIRNAISVVRQEGDTVSIEISEHIELICNLPEQATHIEFLLYVDTPALPTDTDVTTEEEAITTGGQTSRLRPLSEEYASFEQSLESLVQNECENNAVLEFKAIDHTEITDSDLPDFYTFHAQMDLRADANQ